MSNYTQHITDAQVKAGDAAINYCIEHGLAAYYLMTKEGGCEYVESGPYDTLELAEEAFTEKNNRFKFYIRLLFKDEAEVIINFL